MTAAEFPALASILPELILAVGALALLMIGVFAGDRSARLVNALAIVVLALAAWAVDRHRCRPARSGTAPSSSTALPAS